ILGPPDEEPTRGTEFWLMDHYAEALEDALRSNQVPGMIDPDQSLLLLRSATQSALNEVLSRADLTGGVAWAARIGSGEMLIALAPEVSESELIALHSALETVDIDISRYRTMDVMNGEAMRRLFVTGKETSRDLKAELK